MDSENDAMFLHDDGIDYQALYNAHDLIWPIITIAHGIPAVFSYYSHLGGCIGTKRRLERAKLDFGWVSSSR